MEWVSLNRPNQEENDNLFSLVVGLNPRRFKDLGGSHTTSNAFPYKLATHFGRNFQDKIGDDTTNSDFCDCISLNTWVDSTGGGKNMICISKNELRMILKRAQYNNSGLEYDGSEEDSYAEVVTKNKNGRLGLGTSNPNFPLHVADGNHTGGNIISTVARYISNGEAGVKGPINWNQPEFQDYDHHKFSIYARYAIHSEKYVSASDDRIKDNIEDVPDDLALQQIRDIPCRYYTYRDLVIKGNNRTIGFIAQEVKDVIPEAVSQISEYIPDEYRLLSNDNIVWNSIDEETYNLTITDLSPSENTSYRFDSM